MFFHTVKTILTAVAGNFHQILPLFAANMLLFWEHPFILVVETRDQGGKLNIDLLLLHAKVIEVFFITPQYFFFEPQFCCVF